MKEKFCTSCYSPRITEGGRFKRTADGRTRFICKLCLDAIKSKSKPDHAWLSRGEDRSHRHSPGV